MPERSILQSGGEPTDGASCFFLLAAIRRGIDRHAVLLQILGAEGGNNAGGPGIGLNHKAVRSKLPEVLHHMLPTL